MERKPTATHMYDTANIRLFRVLRHVHINNGVVIAPALSDPALLRHERSPLNSRQRVKSCRTPGRFGATPPALLARPPHKICVTVTR